MSRFQVVSVDTHPAPFATVVKYVVRDNETLSFSNAYNREEADALAVWLDQREGGYAGLKKFEGGKLWPKWSRTVGMVLDAALRRCQPHHGRS
jgi:hypothetical protein